MRDDGLTIAVYEAAGFPPQQRDVLGLVTDYLSEARKEAIRERTGQELAAEWAAIDDPEGYLARCGFDGIMRKHLLCFEKSTDLLLFVTHTYELYDRDRGPLKQASLEGCYNRALLAMKEDVSAIDEAVAAVTGRGRGRAK